MAAGTLLLTAPPASASFGIEPGSFKVTALNRDGSTDTQAGSHPYAYTVAFAFNQNSSHETEGNARDVEVELPPGLVGNPLAIPRCPHEDFEFTQALCPGTTQVGVLHPLIAVGELTVPAYDLFPPTGFPARLGGSALGFNATEDASLRTGAGYRVAIAATNIPVDDIRSLSQVTWGVPSAPAHDPERQCVSFLPSGEPKVIVGCSSDAAERPFLTLPTSCGPPLETTLRADSKAQPGVFDEQTALSRDAGGNPTGLSGCDRLPFAPTIEAQPETTASDSPTGLHVDLHVPQHEEPGEELATADLKNTVVTLPAGMAVNPSSADGLAGCTSAQFGLTSAPGATPITTTPGPAQCPAAAKLGSVEVDTPLIDHPLEGAVYLAAQGDNPFKSLLALYIAVNDPETGVVVKLAGQVEPNPQTGQLKATFGENPQLPFEDFKLDFSGGPRAPLTTPPTCGHYTTATDLTPWSAPEGRDAFPSSSFNVTSGPNGGACAKTLADQPNTPTFHAGTETPIAGSYSPFLLRLGRENGSQPLHALNLTLPPGLTGKLAGVGECSQSGIEQAENRKHEGEGALEQRSPSCPLGSEVGTVNVGAGSGTPLHVGGHAYLAGPYKGAPLSLAIITPAVAGPFDLGVVVVRAALYVNPETAQITTKSDPIPTILAGIPLDVRSIAVHIDRNRFTLNPTNCNPMSFTGTAFAQSSEAALTAPFQVGACAALGFKPHLALSLKGATKRTGTPAFKAVLTYPKKGAYANIAKAQVTLPPSEILEQGHLEKVCRKTVFTTGSTPGENCPKNSIYGRARAFTPLLDEPLEGPVFLRTGYGTVLPQLAATLNNKQIHIVLAGKIDAVVKKGTEISRIRNTFAAVPDAPVSKFVLEMKGGDKGLLVNKTNICKGTHRAIAHFTAQSGKVDSFNPLLQVKCRRGHGKRHKRAGAHL